MSTIDASSKASIINSTKLRGLFAWYRKWLLFRNEFIPVFIPNEILALEGNFILVSLNWKRMSFWIADCSLRASGACVPDLARKPRKSEPLRLPDDVIMWMQYKLHSGTELILRWKSLRYHVNNMILNYPQITWLPVAFSKWIDKS